MENKPEILVKGIALSDWNHDISCKECWTSSRVIHAHVWATEYSYYASCPSCDSDVYIEANRIPISIRRVADANFETKRATAWKNFWDKFWQWVSVLGVISCCVAATYGCVSHLRHGKQSPVVFINGVEK